ncbi:glutaminase [Candidatus Symbiopectobacterium sp.]|uniref:glutaminase n=1 Tax=Candidatus Symbiopectobacterium sp. TaxID=2816440 RepID=UPI0025C308D4|nr:glutaminase [Candidatus Symbiopectobacterium sp.]
MATFAITVFFHRRCLFTKRASYINFIHCIPHPKPDISHCNQHIEYTTDLYTRQCSLNISARDLAVMGATLADGGVNPITRDRVVNNDLCHYALAVMVTAGLYETSCDWLYDIGLPGKSGIGGGIVTVSHGKGGLGTFAPLLDGAGNSVKGQLAARFLSRSLGMDMFVSEPYTEKS